MVAELETTETGDDVARPTNAVRDSRAQLLAEFIAEEPEKQTRATAARADFVPDPEVLKRVTASLEQIGAITSAKGYGSEKEARKAGAIWRIYAEHAVEGIEGKSIGPRMVKRGDQFHWKFQLTTKRERKEKTDSETPAKGAAKDNGKSK